MYLYQSKIFKISFMRYFYERNILFIGNNLSCNIYSFVTLRAFHIKLYAEEYIITQ